MRRLTDRPTRWIARLWAADRPLTAVSLLMLASGLAASAGLLLDDRMITGAPAWLKPAKFGISTAIYGFTLAWIFSYLPAWTATRRTVGWTTAVVFVTEVAIIDLQAWRGTTSHFNVSTPLDGALFGVMGLAIVVQTLSSVAVAVALWRQTFADAALGWALRLGTVITIIGGASGGLMTVPTAEQRAAARLSHAMPVAGAHTVGAPDGAPGMAGTGWSRAHGDLRVPHFVGLHAMQVLPLTLLLWPRRAGGATRTRVALVAGMSYLALFGLLIWQALRGEALLHPSALTMTALWGWLAVSAVGLVAVTVQPSRRDLHAVSR